MKKLKITRVGHWRGDASRYCAALSVRLLSKSMADAASVAEIGNFLDEVPDGLDLLAEAARHIRGQLAESAEQSDLATCEA